MCPFARPEEKPRCAAEELFELRQFVVKWILERPSYHPVWMFDSVLERVVFRRFEVGGEEATAGFDNLRKPDAGKAVFGWQADG